MQSSLFSEQFEKYKFLAACGLLGLFFTIIGLRVFLATRNSEKISFTTHESKVASAQAELRVDIAGSVAKPGVYELSKDSRLEDLVKKSGGFSEDADLDWVAKQINLAQKLVDGAKFYIPNQAETQAGVVAGAQTSFSNNSNDIVNINSASNAELEALPGIGPVTAAKIIAGRPYQSIEELLTKKSLNKGVFEEIKDQISL